MKIEWKGKPPKSPPVVKVEAKPQKKTMPLEKK